MPALTICLRGIRWVPFLTETATTHTFTGPDQVLDSSKDYVAVIETDVGRMVMCMYEYTVFGKVIEGLGLLSEVARGEPPLMPTRMLEVHIGAKAR